MEYTHMAEPLNTDLERKELTTSYKCSHFELLKVYIHCSLVQILLWSCAYKCLKCTYDHYGINRAGGGGDKASCESTLALQQKDNTFFITM